MTSEPPEGAVGSKSAKVASALMGTFLATIWMFVLFGLLGFYALMLWTGSVTVTGWIALLLLFVPLGFALANIILISRGAAWRVVPWIVWMVGFVVLAFALTLFVPNNYRLYVPDRPDDFGETGSDVG